MIAGKPLARWVIENQVPGARPTRLRQSLATHLCRRDSYARAIDIALEAIQLEPLRASAHHTLITVHLHEENVIEAVRHFRSFSRLLRDELGVEPSPRIAALISNGVPAAFDRSVIRGAGDC
ncbi:MAG: AfsR/SARP family transcriptional regulator [Pseudonocardiaceae bacterium]